MSIPQSLKDYQTWYNNQVDGAYTAPKCKCGYNMMWSSNNCENCASYSDIQMEVGIIQWYLKNDISYWSSTLNISNDGH